MLCSSILVIEWVVWCGCGMKVLSACVICIVLSKFSAFMKRGVAMGGVREWVMIMNLISLRWRDFGHCAFPSHVAYVHIEHTDFAGKHRSYRNVLVALCS